MRKLYRLQKRRSIWNKGKVILSAGLAAGLFLFAQSSFAQETLTWTGAVDTSATNTANWDPQLDVEGNILVLDSAATVDVTPAFDGSANISVARLTLANGSRFNVHMTDPSYQFKNNDGSSTYLPHDITINISQGEFYNRKNFYLEDSMAIVNISGHGSVRVGSFWAMCKMGTPRGGFVNISDSGFMICDVWPQRYSDVDSTKGVITITDAGYMDLAGDATAAPNLILDAIARNQIKTTPDRDIVLHYDKVTNRTKLYSRDKMAFVIEPVAAQRLVANTDGDPVYVVPNEGWTTMQSFQWKYGTVSGGPYDQTIAGATNDTLYPNMSTPGTYYIVCVGNNGTTDVTSNEFKVIVASDQVHIAPTHRQLLKVGQEGYMLTVTEDQTADSRDWKYSMTSGQGYQSFSTPITGTEYTPVFDTPGDYYVICESMIGGVANPSTEVAFTVIDTTTDADIFWTGAESEAVTDMRNWDPYAHIFNNSITVNPDYTTAPVLSAPGVHHVYDLWLAADASFTVDMPSLEDTLYRGSDQYQDGDLIVKGGVYYLKGRLRLETGTPSITVTDNGKIAMGTDFIVGKSDGSVGAKFIDISGNGVIDAGSQIWRYATDTTVSVITIKDQGKLIVHGDYRGGFQTAMDKNQIKTIEGRELVMDYPVVNGEDTTTVVYSRDLAAFEVTPVDEQFVGIGEPVSTISTVNADAVTAFDWKYTTTSGSGYTSFDPAVAADTFAGSFSEAGKYYVVCEGTTGAGTVMSSEVPITVVSVDIAPVDTQKIETSANGTTLTATESTTADSREWMWSDTQGTGYQSFIPPQTGETYTPLFLNAGTYYIVCESVVGGKTFTSNEVVAEVTEPTAVNDAQIDGISLYPNPSSGAFYLTAGKYQNYTVTVSDVQGRTILNKEFNNATGRQVINLNKKGVFIVNIITSDKVITKRLVVE